MHLARLYLRDFRGYRSCEISLTPGINVFLGHNAAGKTNLLEAVHLLATGRSPRTPRDKEMVAFGATSFYLKGLVERQPAPLTIELAFDAEKGKAARVNGQAVTTLADLAARMPCVYFSPDELRVVSGGPAWRRAFLDGILCQASPAYAHHLEWFRRSLEQRNALLREARAGRTSIQLLEAWDEELALYGGELLARRAGALATLSPRFLTAYDRLGAGEGAALAYRPALTGCAVEELVTAAGAAARYQSNLEERRADDVARAFTSAGPHRDDFVLELDGLEARAYASQGQRRSLVLALLFAAAGYLEEAAGVRPLLLLDDVLSELDAGRRQHLLEAAAAGHQALVTAASPDGMQEFSALGGNCYQIKRGEVTPLGWPSAC